MNKFSQNDHSSCRKSMKYLKSRASLVVISEVAIVAFLSFVSKTKTAAKPKANSANFT